MSLESNGAIEVPLILRGKNGAVYLPIEIPHEVFLADVAHLVCKKNGNKWKRVNRFDLFAREGIDKSQYLSTVVLRLT